MSKRSFLRGGLYHLSLIFITAASFNWGFVKLTGIDVAARIFVGANIPEQATAILLCVAAVMVLWNNWVD